MPNDPIQPLAPKQAAELRQMVKAGMSRDEIADHFDLRHEQLTILMRAHGLRFVKDRTPRQPVTERKRKQVTNMLRGGFTVRDIQRATGLSRTVIRAATISAREALAKPSENATPAPPPSRPCGLSPMDPERVEIVRHISFFRDYTAPVTDEDRDLIAAYLAKNEPTQCPPGGADGVEVFNPARVQAKAA